MQTVIEGIKDVLNGQANNESVEMIVFNEDLGFLSVLCNLERKGKQIHVGMNVYSAQSDREIQVAPIAMSKLRIDRNYAAIEKLYVGRKFRKNGIGTMLVKMMEDIVILESENKEVYFLGYFDGLDKESCAIRKEHGKPSTTKGVIDNFLGKKLNRYNDAIAYKFYSSLGYNAEKFNQYDKPRKLQLKKNGYLVSENNEELKALAPVQKYGESIEM